jgi:hypothetical protein
MDRFRNVPAIPNGSSNIFIAMSITEGVKGRFAQNWDVINFMAYRKTSLLVPGVDQFSNANSFVLDQLVG